MEEIVELIYSEIVRSGYSNSLAAGIVITGGGAQLQNLVQLVEYITGMDTRIGYPNEHLGKSKIDAVKSPMHATGVGLVLAGYQSLDQREEKHVEVQQQPEVYNKVVTKTANKEGSSKRLLDRLKGLLSDDID